MEKKQTVLDCTNFLPFVRINADVEIAVVVVTEHGTRYHALHDEVTIS